MKKIIAAAGIAVLVAGVLLIGYSVLTKSSPSASAKPSAPKAYTSKQAKKIIVPFINGKLSGSGSVVSAACVQYRMDGKGNPVEDKTGESPLYACILSITSPAGAECDEAGFKLPVGSTKPEVLSVDTADASYCK